MEVKTSSVSQNLVDIYSDTSKMPQSNVLTPFNNQLPQDEVTFNEMSVDLVTSKEKNKNCSVVEGKINGKNAVIKEALTEMGDNFQFFVEGIIDNKKLLISRIGKINTKYAPANWVGKYNGQDVDLTITAQQPTTYQKFKRKVFGTRFFPDYMSISGRVGNKEVNINIPGSDVPKDNDTKELVTLLLYERGYKPCIVDKKIVGYSLIEEFRKELSKDSKEREQKFDKNIRPLIIGSISTAVSLLLGLLIGKLGKK